MNRYTRLSPRPYARTAETLLAISDDGYIRARYAEIQNICFMHLMSGVDQDAPAKISDGAVLSAITGYTEWVTDPALGPAITIGWDWQMDLVGNQIGLRRISEPRSNVMLRDANRLDLGPVKTIALLELLIDALAWQPAVRNFIDVDCAP